MMVVRQLNIHPRHLRQMLDTLKTVFPAEGCGLLGGIIQLGVAYVNDVQLITNISQQSLSRYQMDPRQMVQTLFSFEQNNLQLIGIFHSHPHHAPIPSTIDIAACTWPEVAYVIIGHLTTTPTTRAWNLGDGQAIELPIIQVE